MNKRGSVKTEPYRYVDYKTVLTESVMNGLNQAEQFPRNANVTITKKFKYAT